MIHGIASSGRIIAQKWNLVEYRRTRFDKFVEYRRIEFDKIVEYRRILFDESVECKRTT
jgi:hypothetical protein